MNATAQLDAWEGKFGDEYTARNAAGEFGARVKLWRQIWNCMAIQPKTALEVGCNVGQNMRAIVEYDPFCTVVGIEPNAKALNQARSDGLKVYNGTAENLDFAPDAFDLVFTSGVLIHLSPVASGSGSVSPLRKACKEVARVSRMWVVAIEYFSAEPREVKYRDRKGLLWTRDFGKFYVDECGLKPVACGFAWKEMTGLDNVTWWLLRKDN